MKTRFLLIVVCFTTFAIRIAYAAPGDLFASINGGGHNGAGSISEFTPAGVQSTFASGLDRPRGLAFDSAGDLFVDTNTLDAFGNIQGTILKFTPGGTESTFATGFGTNMFLEGMAIDKAGDVFITALAPTAAASTIFKVTPGGTESTFASTTTQLFGLAFDHAGNLFAVSNPATTASQILKFTPGGVESTFATASSNTVGFSGLAFDNAGNLFVSNGPGVTAGASTILKFTSGGVESTFATGLTNPRGLAFDSAGNLFAAEFPSLTTGDILKFTPGGIGSVFASGLSGPTWLAFQPVTGSATWGASPASGDWNTPGNWNPATVPNGSADTATFGRSNTTSVSISANTEVNGIVFNSGASAFTITASPTFTLTISGVGITNNSGVTQNFVTAVDSSGNAGVIQFSNSATAGGMTVITNQGGGVTGGFSGFTGFNNSSSAGSATIINNATTVSGAFGGVVNFNNTSSAGSATIINNGSTLSADGTNGITIFLDSSTAGAATLIANGGTGGGSGGRIGFDGNSDGGTARVEVFGNGKLDISGHNAPGVTIGSVEGDGNVFLGANNLTVGSNNLSTTFSGVMQDGGHFGGMGGSLTKIGTGTLDLTGANTYTGDTNINGGVLKVDGSITSNTFVNPSGTLAGTGTIHGTVANNGGTVSPGDAPGTLTVNGNYTQGSGGVLNIQLASPTLFSRLAITGTATLMPMPRAPIRPDVPVITGANLVLDFIDGFAPTTGETFDFFSAGGGITGMFSNVTIEGLEPGFMFTVSPEGVGNFDLIALNNGVSSVPDQGATLGLLLVALFGCALFHWHSTSRSFV